MAKRGLRTRVFDIAEAREMRLSELAEAMGLALSLVYRVKNGERGIGEPFMVGAKRAFPGLSFGELFYVEEAEEKVS